MEEGVKKVKLAYLAQLGLLLKSLKEKGVVLLIGQLLLHRPRAGWQRLRVGST